MLSRDIKAGRGGIDLQAVSNRRADIQGLRGIAVLAVVLYHAGVPGFGGGFVGVDVFFVISGFVITGVLQREIAATGKVKLSEFYAGRVRRLAPALLATLLGTFVAGFLLLAPAHFHDLSASVVFAALGASNFLFWQQTGYFDISSEFKPLLHTWSLGVEQQFYLVWPFVLIVCSKLPRAPAVAFLIAVGALSLWLNIRYEQDAASIFFLPWFRVFEFVLGAGIFWTSQLRRNDLISLAASAASRSSRAI